MQTLEQLIDDPSTTVVDIFQASDNVGEIVDAAAIVRADFSLATDIVEEAIDAAQAAINRHTGSEPDSAIPAAMEQAREAMSAARNAGLRYRPWRIALDKLDKAIRLQRIVESN